MARLVVIPVLGIPVINRPDLLAACVASIDYPVGRLVIIDNSFDGGIADDIVVPDLIEDLFITEPPANLGFSGSINHVIKTHPDAPWWCIANADIVFGPGDLARLAAETTGTRWVGLTDWRAFGLTADAVDAAGFWDENFHPAYCEDADYEYRCRLAGVDVVRLDSTTSHIGSVCWTEDDRGRRNNARSYPANLAYYVAKWGGPLRGGERFQTPFDKGGSVAEWTLDRRRLADQAWR